MFFNKLLVAIDDSVPSQYAIDIGLIIAKRDECPVIFCIVLDPALLAQNYGLSSICELAESFAAEILAGALKRASEAGVQATSKVLFHDACQGIIDLANAENVGMIAMGTHGRTGIARALTRSIAESVLRRTTTPLCVIRRPPIGKIYGRFLVPFVDDELGQAAYRYAVDLAGNFDSTLLFCTITDSSGNRRAEELLERAKRFALDRGIKSIGVALEGHKSISSTILEQAGVFECDAIVMASHGRDGFMRLVKGSVTEAVIRSSLTPVIVIR